MDIKLPTLEQSLIQSLKDENNRLRQRVLNLEQRVKELMLDKVQYTKKGGKR